MRYERDGELLTRSAPRDLAYIKEDWKGMAYDKGDGAYMRQQLGQIRRPQPGSGAAWEISGAGLSAIPMTDGSAGMW